MRLSLEARAPCPAALRNKQGQRTEQEQQRHSHAEGQRLAHTRARARHAPIGMLGAQGVLVMVVLFFQGPSPSLSNTLGKPSCSGMTITFKHPVPCCFCLTTTTWPCSWRKRPLSTDRLFSTLCNWPCVRRAEAPPPGHPHNKALLKYDEAHLDDANKRNNTFIGVRGSLAHL